MKRLKYSGSGAYLASICHYCGKKATTSDHVVPRSAFRMHQSHLPYWFRQHNIVPCCGPCNGFKADYRSDCGCEQCTWVWDVVFGTGWLKKEFKPVRRWVIRVGQSRM